MSNATVTLSDEAQQQALQLQRQVPTLAEALLSIRWALADNPRLGERVSNEGFYSFRRDPAPGSPGVRVTYTYRPGEVVIVAVELTG